MIRCAFSPCPNDTFLFHGWVKGYVGKEVPLTATLLDIEQLNQAALDNHYPLCKVSTACLPSLIKDYLMLPIGAALGKECGPKIVALRPFSLSDFSSQRIAIPGQHTTAHALLNLLLPCPQKKEFCLYHETTSLLKNKRVDCALIIHEQRFTFLDEGFVEILDLGQLWHQKYGLPIPLGCLVANRALGSSLISEIIDQLRRSLALAHQFPHLSYEYIAKHSQIKEAKVIQQHIHTYVTQETTQLSSLGIQAIKTLLPSLPPSQEWLAV